MSDQLNQTPQYATQQPPPGGHWQWVATPQATQPPMLWYLTIPASLLWLLLIDISVTLLLYQLPAVGSPFP